LKPIIIEGITIPKGTSVVVIPDAVQHNPYIWGDDVGEFKPERWDDLAGKAASPYAYEAFNNGPRICPGKAFSYLEIKAILIELIRNYSLEKYEDITDYENPALTMKPKGGLRIKFRKLWIV
jgi:cytochrome P450